MRTQVQDRKKSDYLSHCLHAQIKRFNTCFRKFQKKEINLKSTKNNCGYFNKPSPLRLKRILKSIPTPTSSSEFSEEEAIALMFELGLSRNKYLILRNADSKRPRHTSIIFCSFGDMSSLVPLRVQNTGPSSSSKAYIWVNSKPGSKNFYRPISFEFTKENKDNTKNLGKTQQINDLTLIL